ncbi:YraN family protein [Kribbella sp. NBC_01245]|uniref:YraN family protein n=1 Tax=Kribbella sp. NBC_01245 TaxID=2903578 RepID=UPI002E2D353E|nr:YraN family protein [Kribbella sp. NBC_01245]
MQTKNAVGQYGEDLAASYLVGQGFSILERNWRCDLGEVDIVAREGSCLVICEVKTRRGLGYGNPLETITYRKLARLRQLAGRWLQEHEVHPEQIRIDVIGVITPPHGEVVVEHLRSVA